jgi:ribosomal-protein-alanine N-acetyltransferase
MMLDGENLDDQRPSGAKAPLFNSELMYGLKPIPFMEPVLSTEVSLITDNSNVNIESSSIATGQSVRIRRMTPADVERVLAIAASLPTAPHWPRAAYLDALEQETNPQRIALVAEADAVVGFAVASLLPPEAELELIAVSPEAQRRGVAGMLFAALAKELYTAKVFRIMLEVRAANLSAIALYQRLGFVEIGRRRSYYSNPVEDAVVMRLELGGHGRML